MSWTLKVGIDRRSDVPVGEGAWLGSVGNNEDCMKKYVERITQDVGVWLW